MVSHLVWNRIELSVGGLLLYSLVKVLSYKLGASWHGDVLADNHKRGLIAL